MKQISALIAVAGLAAVASAQSYTIETQWVAQSTSAANGGVGTQLAAGAVVNKTSNQITVNTTGAAAGSVVYAQRFQLQARVVGVSGQGNLGVLAVRGAINASENAIANPASAPGASGLGDRSPFNFGPATEVFRDDGAPSAGGRVDEIFNFSSDRDAFPQATWGGTVNDNGTPDDDSDDFFVPGPAPTAPAAFGASSFTAIYNILVQVLNTGDRVITIGVTQGDSRGLQAWNSVPNPIPEPNIDNQTTTFNWLGVQMTGERTLVNSSFQINVIPAPASMALLGLGGLVAARRRRA